MRQQYLVPRKIVKKLREMSRREGVSAAGHTPVHVLPEWRLTLNLC
jgi:hypothetical protein